jgi:O-antigen/teichoic acid export membrane protein
LSLIAKNSLLLTVAKFLSIAIYAVFGMVLARQVNTSENGVYSLMATFLFFGGMISSFGIPLVITREVARAKELTAKYYADGVLAVIVGTVVATIALGGYLLFEQYSRDLFVAGHFILFAITMLVVFADAIGAICDSLFQAHERMAKPAAIEILTGLVRAGLAMFAIYVLPSEYRVPGVLIGFLIGSTMRAFIMPRLLKRNLLDGAIHKTSVKDALILIKSSGFIAVFRMLRMLRNRLDILLIGVLFVSMVEGVAADADVARAIYTQAVRVAIIFHTITIAFNTALFPRMAQQTGDNKDVSAVRQTYARAVRWQGFWAIPLAAIVFVYANPIANFFGSDYLLGSPENGVLGTTGQMLQVLLIAVLFDCLGGPIGFVMLGYKDTERKAPMIGAVIASSSLVLNLLLIPRFGILGAAMASAITAVVEFVIKVAVVAKHLGSPIPIFLRLLPYIAITAVSVGAIFLVGLEDYAIYGTLLAGVIYTILCAVLKQLDPVVVKVVRDRVFLLKRD